MSSIFDEFEKTEALQEAVDTPLSKAINDSDDKELDQESRSEINQENSQFFPM
ncbi:MAG: hypothetical protein HQL45_14440 [Alphaproteobacteria bacterium]|nr:hypothetical protein [Alphaproteobacteria bacterium]